MIASPVRTRGPLVKHRELHYLTLLVLPSLTVFAAFFLLPMARLVMVAGSGEIGARSYVAFLTTPRYLESLIATIVLSASVTAATLAISVVSGLFLERNRFSGRKILISLLTFPLAFREWSSDSWSSCSRAGKG